MNKRRVENYLLAVKSLREYLDEPVTSKRDLAGLAFGFVMAFELAWKCVQDRVADMGYTERGPKPVLAAALQAGLIPTSEELVWSQMLEDRNLASHVYSQGFAEELVERIRKTHTPALESLLKKLQT